MTYLDLVCKESLRLYPSVPIFGRTVPEEMTVCKYKFKSGLLDYSWGI
jgi:cytochrome P450